MSNKGSAKRQAAARAAAARQADAKIAQRKKAAKDAARKEQAARPAAGLDRAEQPTRPRDAVPDTLALVPADVGQRPAAGPGSALRGRDTAPVRVDTRFRADVFTRRASRTHSERGPMSIVVDLYTAVFSLAVVLTMIGSTLYAFRKDFHAGPSSILRQVIEPQYSVVPTGTAISAFTLLGLTLVISMAVRLGPMSATPAQSFWWLDLPIDRTSFLRGMLIRRSVIAFAVALVLSAPATLAFQSQLNAGLGLLAAASIGLVCVCAILVAALLQIYGGSRVISRIGVAAAVAVFASFVAEALLAAGGNPVPAFDRVWASLPTNWPQLIMGGTLWPLAVLVVLTVLLGVAVTRGLARLHAADLARSGAVIGHVSASLYFTDFNELGRALAQERRASRRGRFLGKGPHSPVGALVHAEALTFLRAPGLSVQLLVLAAAPVCVGLIAGFGNAVAVAAVIVVTGCWAAGAAGAAAKETAIVPELDALVPLGAKTTRIAHAFIPAIVLLCWTFLLFGALALLGAGGWGMLVLALISALGLAGASVRGAYRVAATSSAAPGMDMGMMPGMGGAATMIRNIFHGHDVAILSLAPVIISLFTGVVTEQLLLVQIVASGLAFLWGTWVKSGKGLADMMAPPPQK